MDAKVLDIRDRMELMACRGLRARRTIMQFSYMDKFLYENLWKPACPIKKLMGVGHPAQIKFHMECCSHIGFVMQVSRSQFPRMRDRSFADLLMRDLYPDNVAQP